MRRNKNPLFVHLVWATWDRMPLLVDDVQQAVYRSIGAKCEELEAELVALGGVEDHVHLLVHLPATLSVADLVKHIKGVSAHLIGHKPRPNEFFRWQGSYAAFSVSVNDLAMISNYIKHQLEHHANGMIQVEWELDDENALA